MATDIEIFIGTSQDFLLSFKVKKADDNEFVLERFIVHRCHNGSIISMDTKGRYLATGGSDDRIVIIDLKLNRDVHEIIRHEGSINSLLFTNKGSDLLSASEDGRLIATQVGSWKPVNIWKKPHTGKSVMQVCLHHTDKFALTLGKDGTLRGWDMFKGSQINTFNTKDLSDANIALDKVELCPDGSTFAISGEKTVALICLTQKREEPYDEITLKSRVTSMCWLDNENLLIGMENGSIQWTNINKSEHVLLPNIHPRRIKGMHHLNGFLGTICSSGSIALWATKIPDKTLTLICTTTDESMRPTCIKMINTTENRYKEPVASASNVKDSQPRIVKQRRPISTTAAVIVETDDNEKDEIVSTNQNRTVRDSTAAKFENTAEKKKSKKKAINPVSSDSQLTKPKSGPTKDQKRKTPKTVVQKKIFVRSANSDDDFETPQKKKAVTPSFAIQLQATNNKQRKSSPNTASPNVSTVSVGSSKKKSKLSRTPLSNGTGTPLLTKDSKTEEAIPASCPPIVEKNENSQKSMKKRKLVFNTPEPSPTHLMATRKRKKTL